jgi:hypothetical protein
MTKRGGMSMTFNSFHSDYELTVQSTHHQKYMVVMTNYQQNNQSNVLHVYSSEPEAVQAAKLFPARYQQAQVRGYILQNQYLQHSSGKSIHISFVMDLSISDEKLRSILDS